MEEQEIKYKDLNPYEDINFIQRRAEIRNKKGEFIFEEDVIFPDFYSDDSVNIVSSKYLCNEAKHKENDIRQMIDRVSETISNWGLKDGYFGTEEKEDNDQYWEFLYKLKYYQINQYFSFNSPVYFNCGLGDKQQLSACFILEIEDDMASIYDSIKMESLIFKHGSGSGMNMSRLRSRRERVRGGGFASGPASFLKAGDCSAGVIKSGGTLRRSAKMACLNDDHPDIQGFIHCKEIEERKLQILKDAGIKAEEGYDMSDHVFYQNTNISVRLSDAFMKSVEDDRKWYTKYILDGSVCEEFKAKDLLMEISELAWRTGDPGVQFSDNMNKWNTCINSGLIEATNPCSEFTFLNNTSCNLASANLLKFFIKFENDKIGFDVHRFEDVVDTSIIAQDIIAHHSSYPSRKITSNSHNFRPLGFGYSNLGATLMWLGLPYNSEEGRAIAALLTAIMTGTAFKVSNELATKMGGFQHFEENQEPFYKVLEQHKENMHQLLGRATSMYSKREDVISILANKVRSISHEFDNFIESRAPFRNAQVTLLAPTGTTSFLMDCATSGIEPGYSLISYKTLAGTEEATIKMVNPMVRETLKNLGYTEIEVEKLYDELHSLGHFANSDILRKEHLPIFDTAAKPEGSDRCIAYMGHVKMLAAVQPFLSGAISKTVNMPVESTVEDVYDLYLEAWRMGLKAVAIYRDDSKTFQPLHTSIAENVLKYTPVRRRLPETRPGELHKFSIGSTEGYIITGNYDNGDLGDVFLDVTKQGSTLAGLLNSLGIIISVSLQYGVPVKVIVDKLIFSRFDPSGITSNKHIRFATSIVDYLARYIGNKYLSDEDKIEFGLKKAEDDFDSDYQEEFSLVEEYCTDNSGAPVCDCCGGMMQRVGTCFNCNNCGANSGACG